MTLGASSRTVRVIIIVILVVTGGYGTEVIGTMLVIFIIDARVTAHIKGYIDIIPDMLDIWSISFEFPMMIFALPITIRAVVRGVITGMISRRMVLMITMR